METEVRVGQRYTNHYTHEPYRVVAVKGLDVDMENELTRAVKTFHLSNIRSGHTFEEIASVEDLADERK